MSSGDFDISAEALQQLPLFQQVDPRAVSSIADACRAFHVGRTDRVLSRGDQLDGFYIVMDGSLKAYFLSCDGSERVLRILQTGDSFGEAMMFNGFPSPVYVEALASSQVAYIPRTKVADALSTEPVFVESLFRGMSQLVLELVRDIEACCLMNAKQRIVAYLLRLIEQPDADEQVITLPASKWVVASMLNLSAETFSRELHRLQSQGLIEIVRRSIQIHDSDGLIDIVNGADTGRGDN